MIIVLPESTDGRGGREGRSSVAKASSDFDRSCTMLLGGSRGESKGGANEDFGTIGFVTVVEGGGGGGGFTRFSAADG